MKKKPKKHQSAMLRQYDTRVIFKEKWYRDSAMLRNYTRNDFDKWLAFVSMATYKPRRRMPKKKR